MTQGQILTFCIIARCCYAKMAVRVAGLFAIGDPTFDDQKVQLVLVRSLLKTICKYNPDAEDNCLTLEEIEIMINRVSEILGLCGDPLSLDESDTTCLDPLNGVTIINS